VTHTGPALDAPTRHGLHRRARVLATAGVTYNVLEAVVALVAGMVAGSSALLAFGLDATVEIAAGSVIIWQFLHPLPDSREAAALRVIGVSFFALAAFVAYDSTAALVTGADPEPSVAGIVLAATSLTLMPLLSRAQRRTGRALHSASILADSNQTQLCTYMSAVLLGGLVVNAAFGWSWADPCAGLLIAALAAKEGRSAWRGDSCCHVQHP
jgi:divalent metal cation (Fe/Co/Zn/Cd) transporter